MTQKHILTTVFFVITVLTLSHCIKKAEIAKPEDTVKRFVELSATAKSEKDREELSKLCAGEMKQTFEKMNLETFRMNYLNQNIKLKEIRITENSIEDVRARIAYEVEIENLQGTTVTQEQNQREVELVKMAGGWFIETIRPKGSDKIAFTRGMIF